MQVLDAERPPDNIRTLQGIEILYVLILNLEICILCRNSVTPPEFLKNSSL
jgi:hypothetical protein